MGPEENGFRFDKGTGKITHHKRLATSNKHLLVPFSSIFIRRGKRLNLRRLEIGGRTPATLVLLPVLGPLTPVVVAVIPLYLLLLPLVTASRNILCMMTSRPPRQNNLLVAVTIGYDKYLASSPSSSPPPQQPPPSPLPHFREI